MRWLTDASSTEQFVRKANPPHIRMRPYEELSAMTAKVLMPDRREKFLRSAEMPVPETDTGGQV